MLGDVLLITDKHREAGEKIIAHILKNRTDKYIVAISGESGSGALAAAAGGGFIAAGEGTGWLLEATAENCGGPETLTLRCGPNIPFFRTRIKYFPPP